MREEWHKGDTRNRQMKRTRQGDEHEERRQRRCRCRCRCRRRSLCCCRRGETSEIKWNFKLAKGCGIGTLRVAFGRLCTVLAVWQLSWKFAWLGGGRVGGQTTKAKAKSKAEALRRLTATSVGGRQIQSWQRNARNLRESCQSVCGCVEWTTGTKLL